MEFDGGDMKEVIISNFGAVNYARVDIDKRMQVLIGEQASGKSTICKTVYFCLKIRDYTLDYLMNKEQFLSNHPNEYFNNLMKYLQKQFMGCFGKTRHMRPFSIEYIFDDAKITVKRNTDGFIRFSYSRELKNEIQKMIDNAAVMHNKSAEQAVSSVFDHVQALSIMKEFFQEHLAKLFCCDSEIVYIPAGRSLLASMSEELDYSGSENMDLTMREFIFLIKRTKSKFGTKIPELRETYTKTVKGQIDDEALRKAYDLIRRVLKADYTSESDGEKIYFDENHWVKLMYGSSGQQEILWILLLAYIFILEKRKTFLVIEEPEAHLFPLAQKNVVELIALMNNVTENNTIITTHSPYILTSLNILLFSNKTESKSKGTPVISRNMRLSYETFGAFLVDSSNPENMIDLLDVETNMIDTEYIDSVSSITNSELNRLIEKEIADAL